MPRFAGERLPGRVFQQRLVVGGPCRGEGELVHTVDVFFIDDEGAGFGFLTQAPESSHYDWLPILDEIRARSS
jgi:hypothetical protein